MPTVTISVTELGKHKNVREDSHHDRNVSVTAFKVDAHGRKQVNISEVIQVRGGQENMSRRNLQSASQQISAGTSNAEPVFPKDTQVNIPNLLEPPHKKWHQHIYDRETHLCCGRTCASWLAMLLYSIMYFIFLATYFLIFLYVSLQILLKSEMGVSNLKMTMMSFKDSGVGLSVAPAGVNSKSLIWYKYGVAEDYDKYIGDLDKLLKRNRTRRKIRDLGPCGLAPYGYGEKPCVVIRINKRLDWAEEPLKPETAMRIQAPKEVQEWSKKDKKLWVHCNGYHSYDQEHIKTITYYPDPPGIDPDVYPMAMTNESPLVAVQLSDFTLGISLSVRCRLWYEHGNSSVEFMLYVVPNGYTRMLENNIP